MHVDYLQVGAHVGPSNQDSLFTIPVKDKTLILIEPVPYLFSQLVNNYEEKSKENTIIFKNIAVSNSDGFLQLYIPSPLNNWSVNPPHASQLASIHEEHLKKHLPYLLVDRINVKCYRLNTLIKEHCITSIDTLLVDTEGHDYDILMDLDLTVLKPKVIEFENSHMDGTFIRGKKYTELLNHLLANGYTIVKENEYDTTVKLID
jgi:FkbM family methyltransferase